MSYALPSAWVIQASAEPTDERMFNRGVCVFMSSVKEQFSAVLLPEIVLS